MSTLTSAHTLDVIPPLEGGDQLTFAEFQHRLDSHPGLEAELIEGVVFVPGPGRYRNDARAELARWLTAYRDDHPGVMFAEREMVQLAPNTAVQPEAYLCRPGRPPVETEDGYIESPPEFIAEIAASAASYQLHTKMEAYRRAGVPEYLVWRVYDEAIDWFALEDGVYVRRKPNDRGLIESTTFPGLRLAAAQMLAGEIGAVLAGQRG